MTRPIATSACAILFLLANSRTSNAFVVSPQTIVAAKARIPDSYQSAFSTIHWRLYASKDKKNNDNADSSSSDSSFDWPVLQARLDRLRLDIIQDENFHRPPNPSLNAYEFVSELLHGLWNHSDPLPDAGMRRLLRSSTPSWKQQLYQSVGAPPNANDDVVATALHEAMARPNNQFALLLDEETATTTTTTTTTKPRTTTTRSSNTNDKHQLYYNLGDEEEAEESYMITFPSEVLDYGDGTCWLECQLRKASTSKDTEKDTNSELLVTTGWELIRRPSDDAWLVDRMDWQDFREEFRPGIGREEWMRICG